MQQIRDLEQALAVSLAHALGKQFCDVYICLYGCMSVSFEYVHVPVCL